MKTYKVHMFNLAVVSLNQDPNPRSSIVREFDVEQEAIDFAKSERKKWDRVMVYKKGEEIVAFQGDYMYMGNKCTRLLGTE